MSISPLRRYMAPLLLVAIAIIAAASIWGGGCSRAEEEKIDTVIPAKPKHPLPDTLRVATLYSPTSYFIYRDDAMGYDYSLVKQLCEDKGMKMDLTVAPSLSRMLELLDSGLVDLIAYELPIIAEYKDMAIPCGPQSVTWQVLVQPRGDSIVSDVTQLVGRDVYVEADSKYQMRLQNLNEELGGGVNIHTVDRDTLITEDLIAMVSHGEIPLTIVDSDIASLNQTYYKDLDIGLKMSFPQESAWAVDRKQQWLADSINSWFNQENHRKMQAELLKRYFEKSKDSDNEATGSFSVDFSKGKISPYDDMFKKYAGTIDYDWRLLAAQGYAESHFDPTAVSWAGARGVMQIMPKVASAYGLTPDKYDDPEASIATSVKLIKELDKSLTKYVKDKQERCKFIVAAYNSGLGHIVDAIALAKKYDLNPSVWSGNVEEALMMKSNPKYYNDPVCRNGYFRGRQTQDYVVKVMDFYEQSKKKIKK